MASSWRESLRNAKVLPSISQVGAIGWIIARLGLILSLAVGPDNRDSNEHKTGSDRATLRSALRAAWTLHYPEIGFVLRFTWRIVSVQAILGVILLAWWVSWLMALSAAAVLCAVAYILLGEPIWQVAAISKSVDYRNVASGKVHDDHHWLRDRCDSTVLVSHSMGGYLSAKSLQRRNCARPSIAIALSSGLRPVSMLSQAKSTLRWSLATCCIVLCFAVSAYSLLSGAHTIVKPTTGIIRQILVVGRILGSAPSSFGDPEFASQVAQRAIQAQMEVMSVSASPALTPSFFIVIAVSAAVALSVHFLAGDSLRSSDENSDQIDNEEATRQIELISDHDTVARSMPSPISSNDKVEKVFLPEVGHPLLDHIRPFRLSSPSTWATAAFMLSALDKKERSGFDLTENTARHLAMHNIRHKRRHRLRGLIVLFVSIALLVAYGAGKVGLPTLVFGVWLTLVACAIVFVFLGWLASRRTTRRMARKRGVFESSVERSFRARPVYGLMLIMAAILNFGGLFPLLSRVETVGITAARGLCILLLIASVSGIALLGVVVIAGYSVEWIVAIAMAVASGMLLLLGYSIATNMMAMPAAGLSVFNIVTCILCLLLAVHRLRPCLMW